MKKNLRAAGGKGESIAADFLIEQGYDIILRNYRIRQGEIDIIAMEGNTIAFVEVKTRFSDRFTHPKYAVTHKKKRTLSKLALAYLKTTGKLTEKSRFDVVSVDYSSGTPQIELIRNAFDLAY